MPLNQPATNPPKIFKAVTLDHRYDGEPDQPFKLNCTFWRDFRATAKSYFRTAYVTKRDGAVLLVNALKGHHAARELVSAFNQLLQAIKADGKPLCATCNFEFHAGDEPHGFFVVRSGWNSGNIEFISAVCGQCAALDGETLDKRFASALQRIRPFARAVDPQRNGDGGKV